MAETKEEKETEPEPEKKETALMSMLLLLKAPGTNGPQFVKNHSAKAWSLALALHSLVTGFYVLCLYHSMNQQILRGFVQFGYTVSSSLRSMSDEMIKYLENSLIQGIAQIPVLGEYISKAANVYLSDSLTLLAGYIASEKNSFLYELYPAISLPEGLGFLSGVVASLIWIILSVIILKIFLCIAGHPLRKISEILSLLAVRSVIRIPIIFIAAIASLFNPALGTAIMPLALLFGMIFMCSVLFKGTDEKSENRLVYVFPFIIIFLLLISLIMVTAEGAVAVTSIVMRLSDFLQTM